MPIAYPIKINGTTIKTPYPFKVARYNLTKPGRVAAGDMTMTFIAKKAKLFLNYEAISNSDLTTILTEIDSTNMFFTVTYYDNNATVQTKIFYVGEIEQTLQRRGTISDDHLWTDVQFNFIEK